MIQTALYGASATFSQTMTEHTDPTRSCVQRGTRRLLQPVTVEGGLP